MFHIYLSNQLENLALMLNKVLAHTVDTVFESQHILVQHKGMQHWLLMQLAQQSGIAMNMHFEPPVGAIWSILRELDPSLKKQSPYKSSILTWRIYALLADEKVTSDPLFNQANRYWQHKQAGEGEKRSLAQAEQRRFQLAKTTADLYEQYQIFRPDWIMQWSAGDYQLNQQENWQAKLWHYLVQQDPRHPVKEMLRLQDEIKQKKQFKPKQRILFGFNSLPPLWLDFFALLAEKQDMHLFLLSPCNEFWQTIQSEKAVAKQRVKWLDEQTDLDSQLYDLGNPLLACLGQHGQAFLKLLYQTPQQEISVFSSPERKRLLHCIQDDILTLQDAHHTIKQSDVVPLNFIEDDSISIHASHSALREVQQLHNWLLDQFNDENTELTPKDVLVMCPSVEDYAPFIEATFRRSWQPEGEFDQQQVRLPCSIADRSFSSSMPLVQLFNQLLALPDNRFNVTQIVETLSSPFVQLKFGFDKTDIATLIPWLNNAAIHWGLDEQHKQQFDLPSRKQFTWQQGLERLLLGFAQSDTTYLHTEDADNALLLLPDVEGGQALLLGRLIHFIECLKQHAKALNLPRKVEQWILYLNNMLTDLFEIEDQSALQYRIVNDAINQLHEHTLAADINQNIGLTVITEYFQQAFNQPQQSQHFMTGQVTFCSLIPMRSIPFKVIVLLGFNDGEFPRLKPANSLDLLAQDTSRFGDRSRRSDDRYLFLECLLSAREKLYISYQGNQIKDNSEKQPSTILLELMHYMAAYGWHQGLINRASLQAFNRQNYQPAAQNQSYDSGWLALLQRAEQAKPVEESTVTKNELNAIDGLDMPAINIDELIRFFDNPARYYAQNQLKLFFHDNPLEVSDSEPFSSDYLTRYQVQQNLVEQMLIQASNGEQKTSVPQYLAQVQASGALPDHALAIDDLTEWLSVAQQFSDNALQQGALNIVQVPVSQSIKLEGKEYVIHGQLPINAQVADNGALLFWRLADIKIKDHLRLYLYHLLANCQQPSMTTGLYRDNKKQQGKNLTYPAIAIKQAKTELSLWLSEFLQGQTQALLLDCAIGEAHFKKVKGKIKPFTEETLKALWQSGQYHQGVGDDLYHRYFWPQQPHWQLSDSERISSLYENMMSTYSISIHDLNEVAQ